jgi:hypothetical protein
VRPLRLLLSTAASLALAAATQGGERPRRAGPIPPAPPERAPFKPNGERPAGSKLWRKALEGKL